MIEFLFLDLDDTILDFHKAEYIAIGRTFEAMDLEPTEEIRHCYHEINQAHWKMLERGVLTRDQVLVQRFERLFEEFGIQVDGVKVARTYEQYLGQGHYFLPGAEKAVEKLSRRYRLFLASNGTASVQKGRMTSADLYRWFEKVFVSQEIGYNKPSKDYFDACFAQISGFDREKCMMVGDSLTSDILGGINAGIRTCWVNPKHTDCGDIKPDYEIEALAQLPELLDTL